MLNVELRNKTFVLLVYAGIITIVLMLIPSAMSYLETSLTGADGTLSETIKSLIANLSHIIKIILWMALVIFFVRYLNFVVFNVALRNSSQNEISSLVRSVVSIIISIVAFFIIFQSQYPNVELSALFTGSTILGIVVGLALQDTLGNLFAGIALQADQSFQVGDVINIQSNKWVGVIEQVSWRGVKIRTFQNKVVVISNAVLGKEVIEVAPKENLNARLVHFNTLYSNPPTKTIQLVRDVISKVENVSTKIRPNVRVRNLGDSGIEYEVKVWLEDYSKYNDTDALIRKRIWYAFRREGIEFAFPTRTLYVQKEKAPIDENEAISEIVMRLAEVSLFTPLSEDEMKRIGEKVMIKLFAPDEPIVKRGQEGNSMFVIHRGAVKVQIRERGKPKVIMKLEEGGFFGEMALFTGEPRTATVIATEETEVLEITHRSLKPILEANPELVERFSEIIESRRVKLSESAESDTMSGEDPKAGVFNSIRKFFGLGKTGE